eukprot:NODE_4646_length_457_cov_68.561275_g4008_i0.p2 GENE.NODE_4646_length_457_cov_68.561275_g4008_i0~~NODE_4646_length_457_cov_68.561275_g4008_i0.p2  ORF type:complete len:62 (+),score=10.67 NODE_4646_length_457_cov_68.561275_g4008_i0:84-269(+)
MWVHMCHIKRKGVLAITATATRASPLPPTQLQPTHTQEIYLAEANNQATVRVCHIAPQSDC